MQVISIGEILWDVFHESEFLGGAPLNFSVNITRLGDSAALIAAVGNDNRGRSARDAMRTLGLRTDFVQVAGHRSTGVAFINTTPEGEPSFEIPRPTAFDEVAITPDTLEKAKRLKADWLYFGTLLQVEPRIEMEIRMLRKELPGVRCFYDMNLRDGHWNLPLVERLCHMATVLKLNESEARTISFGGGASRRSFTLESFCKDASERYEIDTVCVTLGDAGCCVYDKGSIERAPGFPVTTHDTVGAGDAFAAAFLHGYHKGWPMKQNAEFANALGSLVASRAGAIPNWSLQECLQIASFPRSPHL